MSLAFPPFGTSIGGSPDNPGAPITIDATTWRWDGNSGTVLVSSGFPLKPDQVAAINVTRVRVYVNGVEQAVAIQPMDGMFPGGSYRSIGIQFSYNLTNNVPVTAQVKINQGIRGTTDITWTDPTYAAVIINKAVIAPTDTAHLCGSYVTLSPLTPAANDTGVGAAFAAAAAAKWTGTTASGVNSGTAIYDHQNGLWVMYCRTGTRSWYQWAYEWSTQMALGGNITNSISHLLLPPVLPLTPGDSPCTNQSIYNPEALAGTNDCGVIGNEAYGMRMISLASAYWMTAWRQPKRCLSMQVQHGLRLTGTSYTAQRDFWIDDTWSARFNLTDNGMYGNLAAYLTGCNTSYETYSTAAHGTFDYPTHLPWMIDALEFYTWDIEAFLTGLVGTRDDAAQVLGSIETFQLSLIAEFLMVYYDHVKPDTRIPGMLRTMADFIILQTRPATAEESLVQQGVAWVGPYRSMEPSILANSTFTATTVAGTKTMIWTAGPVALNNFNLLGVDIYGPGITASSATHMVSFSGNTMTLNFNCTTTGSGTYHALYHPWYIAMFPALLAWVAAYTGNATYMTWADRYADADNTAALTQTKNWGEIYGGTRLSYLYYRNGGTIRGAAGVHPTVIVNPPIQTVLG